ncbi:MAG TPA: glycine cleavage T C-terminal barrel domain-containing protein, partial [Methylomirabilota bacterium]|nr:glycine cleavage T C-terminal barrel domain-containing protein [Methylomirabilota bacterium]
MPQADALAEYRAARDAVAVVDRSDSGVVEVTGRDRVKFLHALLSNDITALQPGQGCAATLLDIHGKVQVTLFALVLDDRVLLLTPPGTGESTVAALDHYLFAEKVALEDVTGRDALLMLVGPAAEETAKRLTGAAPPDTAWSHVTGSVEGVPARVVRGGGETGLPEVWIVVPADAREAVSKAVLAAGARALGTEALESLRIEAGTPRFGADVDPNVLLPEIPSAHLLSHTKGCYPGQEVVVRIRDRGHVNRHLRGLVLDGDAVPQHGAEIVADGAVVGQVTSATLSLGLRRPIALGFVRRQQAPGARVEVRAGAVTLPATVSELPF